MYYNYFSAFSSVEKGRNLEGCKKRGIVGGPWDFEDSFKAKCWTDSSELEDRIFQILMAVPGVESVVELFCRRWVDTGDRIVIQLERVLVGN